MTPNDRFALELGRAIVRALIAESERDQAKAELEEKLESTKTPKTTK